MLELAAPCTYSQSITVEVKSKEDVWQGYTQLVGYPYVMRLFKCSLLPIDLT